MSPGPSWRSFGERIRMSTSDYPAPRLDGPRLRSAVRAQSISADVWAVAAIVVLAAVIRILTVDNQSFWTDEALTAYEARLPFGAMLNTVAHVETTPPLYFVLVWGWAKIFGTSEAALRSVSTLAGVALVPIAYLSARELVSRWAGVIAAAFVAVNPFMVWYSQEARAYMLLALLTGAGFLWFVRARSDPTRRNLTWWAACSALALMTHFFAGFVVAPEALWLLWIWRTRDVAGAVAVVTAAQLVMLPFALIDTTHGPGWISVIPRVNRVGTAALEWGVSTIYRRATVADGLLGALALIVAVVLLLACAGDRQARPGAKVGAIVGGFVIVAPLVLGFFGQDYFLSRNEIPAFIPFVTVVAAACAVPRARVLGGALAVALLLMFSAATLRVQTRPYLQRPDWRKVSRALGATAVPRAILAADGTAADPLKIYLPDVNWVQQHSLQVLIREVDVVGATKRIALLPDRPVASRALLEPQPRLRFGAPLPRTVAPSGTQLVARFRVNNWIVARFALTRPARLSITQLNALAPRFFRRTPQALLIFVQHPGR
jgi:mannosyltransferase